MDRSSRDAGARSAFEGLRFAFGLAVVLAAGYLGFEATGLALDRAEPQASRGGREGDEPLPVETAEVGERTFAREVRAVGTTRSVRHVDLYPLAEGRVAEIGFEGGQAVDEGQVLLRLDDGAEQAALKAAEATLAEAEAAAARQRQLASSPASSPALVQAAEAALLRAQAQVDEARHTLSERTVEAPFAGMAGLTDLAVGSRVDTSTMVTTLDDLSAVEVVFSVPERFLSRLEEGLPATLTTAAYQGRSFAGTISQIAPRIDAQTRSVALRATVDNRDGALRGGMFMDVALAIGERTAAAAPETALVTEGEVTSVFVLAEGRASRREVTTGATSDGVVEILDGLAPGERVIVSDLHRIADGRPARDAASQPTLTIGVVR